ncbi:hypothetical protein FQR65_LT20652 [Abscondita terminalis]|nr:hypothetical protein FQR65_LT20652 [Abscondita terminalis]
MGFDAFTRSQWRIRRRARHRAAPARCREKLVSVPHTEPHYLARVVTDGSDHREWMLARSRGITATDVAKLSTPRSIHSAAHAKLHGSGFSGNAFTDHGRAREPEIAAWVLREYGISPSQALFHAEHDIRHLATPDGLTQRARGEIELAEIKTTNKEWRTIPRNYLRQVWWQQYVLGAERTLMVWERHENFVPVGDPEASSSTCSSHAPARAGLANRCALRKTRCSRSLVRDAKTCRQTTAAALSPPEHSCAP